MVLTQELTLYIYRKYYPSIDISFKDLEKKNITGFFLVNGKTLLLMVKKGFSILRKENSYAGQRWDTKKTQPKDTVHIVEDIIAFVR